MIDFICGDIVSVFDDSLVVENNGIGYCLTVPSNSLKNFSLGQKAQLFTYLQVKQDGIALFGFSSQEERSMFLRLITVSGVGPKMAATIMGGIKLKDLAMAIVNRDSQTLTSVKGLGKKLSERIILELNEKITGLELGQAVSGGGVAEEAVGVLHTLGVSASNAAERVKQAVSGGAETVEQILDYALKNY